MRKHQDKGSDLVETVNEDKNDTNEMKRAYKTIKGGVWLADRRVVVQKKLNKANGEKDK